MGNPSFFDQPGQRLSSSRQVISFDTGWKFHFGHATDPALDFNYRIVNIFSKSGKAAGTAIAADFNDSAWRTLQLPHDWAVELPFENSSDPDVMAHGYKPVGGEYPASSVGWYRKHFMLARADSGQRWVIRFDGIYRDSKIWINGFYLGSHASGYTGVSYDISNYVHYGRANVLVVRVDASQYEGWYYEGAGIYRHVWLEHMSDLHIKKDGVFVYSEIPSSAGHSGQASHSGQADPGEQASHTVMISDKAVHGQSGSALVHVETTVINENAILSGGVVSSTITDRDGKVLGHSAGQLVSLAANESRTVRQVIRIPAPRCWSPDNPYLYRAIVRITSAGNGRAFTPEAGIQGLATDSLKLRFGIRSIRIDSSGLYVNGQYTKVKGVNAHQDHAGVGTALPDYLCYYRVRLLKEMGVNAYRTSHNPPSPELLDACDSLGLLVVDENRLLNSSPQYLADFEELIVRDRSRASVFLWSIGNEEGLIQTSSIGRRIAATLIQRQKELDPTRLCTYAADLANVFNGVDEVIPVRGFNYRIFGVDPYHVAHPGQPILGTEEGSTVTTRGIYTKDSVACYLPDEDMTAPWWANTAEQWWSLAAVRPWWMGGFVWTGFDYRGEPTPYQWPNISSHFGVMDACGFPKNIYYYYQSWWTDQDVLHISPHWNWKGKEGQPIPVWVNSNADSVELLLNGKSLGQKEMPRNGHLEWKVPYEAGSLEAVGMKKGRRLAARVETTGEPYEIVVTPYKTTLLADGRDASVINISVVDRQGREVPDAGNLVHFSVAGDLRLLGVGNGDPSSHEPDQCGDSSWQRHLFNGKCQVIVQAGTSKSLVRFEAKAEGLQTGSTDIYTVPPGKVVAVHPVTLTPSHWAPARPVGRMLGADISFLPELEARGMKFSDKGVQLDVFQILKQHGFNYIRLRIFKDPSGKDGYSPGKGFCDLPHTMQMARRVQAAGMKLLLDFHYSDTWADPGKQYKPAVWQGEDFDSLQLSVYVYTREVLLALKAQGTPPDMVQVGNEINHGMIWPEGHVRSFDSLAQLVYAGIQAVKETDPGAPVMLHIALGGQNDESHFFLDNMVERKVPFDLIGLSYYPKWHGTLADLKYNVNDLAAAYRKDVVVVEYTQFKREVNEIAFTVPGGRGKGTFIWEPLNTWEQFFDKDGKSNELLGVYDEVSRRFLRK